MSVTIKFTRKQVEKFLEYWDNSVEDWKAEEPKGEELKDLRVIERFFKKLEASVNRS